MHKTDTTYQAYVNILANHLRPALGCTEPISVAYASAKACQVLGSVPDRVTVQVSGSILKNAKSVTVPNTGGKRGIDVACAVGIFAGQPEKELQVIETVTAVQLQQAEQFVREKRIEVSWMPNTREFEIFVQASAGEDSASVRIADRHTHLVQIEKNGLTLHHEPLTLEEAEIDQQEAMLSVEQIFDFAKICDIADVREVLARQIDYNMRIAKEGLGRAWGAQVGRILLKNSSRNDDARLLAKVFAAAASDARMSGCELPVIINSGSGNQGITVSVPVVVYARAYDIPKDLLYRSLIISNLVAIHIKARLGCLSAYCGVVSAACAAAAGIAHLLGGDLDLVNHTLVNGLAVLSGMICDGAKPSCAAKIASSVDSAITAYEMALEKQEFFGGDGIIQKGVENTIANVARLGRVGMRETNNEILRMMI